MEFVLVNGAPGWALVRSSVLVAVAALEIDGGRITGVFATLNPDTLGSVPRRSHASGAQTLW